MKIEIIEKEVDMFSSNKNILYQPEIVIVNIKAKTYFRTRMYAKFDWFKIFVKKFVDHKWHHNFSRESSSREC